nr:MAG TPA: hypothetical protein [Caudoviricetes sp.]
MFALLYQIFTNFNSFYFIYFDFCYIIFSILFRELSLLRVFLTFIL